MTSPQHITQFLAEADLNTASVPSNAVLCDSSPGYKLVPGDLLSNYNVDDDGVLEDVGPLDERELPDHWLHVGHVFLCPLFFGERTPTSAEAAAWREQNPTAPINWNATGLETAWSVFATLTLDDADCVGATEAGVPVIQLFTRNLDHTSRPVDPACLKVDGVQGVGLDILDWDMVYFGKEHKGAKNLGEIFSKITKKLLWLKGI